MLTDGYIADYCDYQLPDLIQFEFHLDFDRTRVPSVTGDNHPSAIKYTEGIGTYISEELSFCAMIGPFDFPRFHFHMSSFLTRQNTMNHNGS